MRPKSPKLLLMHGDPHAGPRLVEVLESCGWTVFQTLSPTVAMRLAGQDPELLLAPGTVAVPLRSQPNASPFWIMLLLVSGTRIMDNGMIRIWQPIRE